MNKLLIFSISVTISYCAFAQSLQGAWETTYENGQGKPTKAVVIFANGYQSMSEYHAETGAFISTNGGSISLSGNQVTEVIEFDSKNPDRVGTSVNFEISLDDDVLKIVGTEKVWKRIDNGTPGVLQGAWLMSGRKRNGTISTRDTSRPRKTMKILSGTRFQWIAYNTETKEFMGTGGGNYTTKNGVYTENIEFFSRDDSRVGASLAFDYELKDGDWHHSGFSSKGDPLYEIWSLRK